MFRFLVNWIGGGEGDEGIRREGGRESFSLDGLTGESGAGLQAFRPIEMGGWEGCCSHKDGVLAGVL